jgi:hypothetical protein
VGEHVFKLLLALGLLHEGTLVTCRRGGVGRSVSAVLKVCHLPTEHTSASTSVRRTRLFRAKCDVSPGFNCGFRSRGHT